MEPIKKHLTAITKNLALQKQESAPPVIGEEKELSLCLAEPKIKNLSSVEPISEALRYCMVLIGLREKNFPGKEEKAMLLDHIIVNYGGHTVSEIRLAFKMAVAGSLELLDGESVNCYENFSCFYFSSIMNAYRRWAKRAVFHLPKAKPEDPVVVITDEEFIHSVLSLYRIHQDFKQIPPLAYKAMKLNLTREQKDEVKKKVDELVQDATQDHYKQWACKMAFDEMG